jgi:hypothetical protein
MLAAPVLINRSMTNYWAGVSGKGNRIIQDGGQINRETDIYHNGPRPLSISSASFSTPLISHWSLPLSLKFYIIIKQLRDYQNMKKSVKTP